MSCCLNGARGWWLRLGIQSLVSHFEWSSLDLAPRTAPKVVQEYEIMTLSRGHGKKDEVRIVTEELFIYKGQKIGFDKENRTDDSKLYI